MGHKTSDKTRKKISTTKKGVPKSPETCDAISRGRKKSDIVKAHTESMRGGQDLVTHHYIYDHNDLSLNTVQMTRKDHSRLHRLLERLGYIVPHVNLPDEDSSETRDEVL